MKRATPPSTQSKRGACSSTAPATRPPAGHEQRGAPARPPPRRVTWFGRAPAGALPRRQPEIGRFSKVATTRPPPWWRGRTGGARPVIRRHLRLQAPVASALPSPGSGTPSTRTRCPRPRPSPAGRRPSRAAGQTRGSSATDRCRRSAAPIPGTPRSSVRRVTWCTATRPRHPPGPDPDEGPGDGDPTSTAVLAVGPRPGLPAPGVDLRIRPEQRGHPAGS